MFILFQRKEVLPPKA